MDEVLELGLERVRNVSPIGGASSCVDVVVSRKLGVDGVTGGLEGRESGRVVGRHESEKHEGELTGPNNLKRSVWEDTSSPERRSTRAEVLAWAAQYANTTAEQAHTLPLAGTTGATTGSLVINCSMVREGDAATGVRVR